MVHFGRRTCGPPIDLRALAAGTASARCGAPNVIRVCANPGTGNGEGLAARDYLNDDVSADKVHRRVGSGAFACGGPVAFHACLVQRIYRFLCWMAETIRV